MSDTPERPPGDDESGQNPFKGTPFEQFFGAGFGNNLGGLGGPGGLPPLMMVAAGLELVGGLLLVLGLFTRPAAFILSGFMAVADFMAHASASLYPIKNHGELAVALCFVFLYMAFAGGGRWSVDAMWKG